MAYEDFFGLQPPAKSNVQFFVGGTEPLQVWQKPRGATMLFLFGVGAGSGGGGGMSGSTGTVRGGGGGGASGALTRVVIPMFFVPDRLYVQVGAGGEGGAATVNGGVSVKTFVSIDAAQTSASMLLLSANHSGTGGIAGSTSGAATAGVAGVINTIAEVIQGMNGICQFIAGKVGAPGGTNVPANGAANILLNGSAHQFNGGSGGGTTGAANGVTTGGQQTGAGPWPTIAGGPSAGGFGRGAPFPIAPCFMSYGGTGGGSASGAPGGDGGGAALGSGGGGGGGGSTGGRGGDGGPGFVLAVSW